ncbi:MAG: lytic transglycosylase domain-containing protein [Treponema sp.]|nr:lytic transglycosylase domain-containing protein [Treponema sp.]
MKMSFQTLKMKFIIPLFLGVFCSLFVCARIFIFFNFIESDEPAAAAVIEFEEEQKDDGFIFSITEKVSDPILEYYRDPDFQQWVIDFFVDICSSNEIALAILSNADYFEVSPALAFALCWEESRFNPNAINRNNVNGSIDRGLFQLNSNSFPHLDIPVFYNIQANANFGISYLRQCLNSGGTEVSALAMYNAGTGRVRSTGAPHVTLNYISRILENRQKIESRFHSRLIREEEARLVAE